MSKSNNTIFRKAMWLLISLIPALSLMMTSGSILAEGNGRVEVLSGRIEPDSVIFYALPNLEQGEKLFVYAKGISGNLDPFVAMADATLDSSLRISKERTISDALKETFTAKVDHAIAAGRDPLIAIPEIAQEFFLIWDDDSGRGYDAAFEFTVPADGNYQLLITSTPAKQTFGDYRLLVGVDEPKVLTGEAEPTGERIAILNEEASRIGFAVQEVSGELTVEKPSTFVILNDMLGGDTLYVFAEATSGDLAPIIFLNDSSDKPLRSGNFDGKETRATLQYTFDENAHNYRLKISSCCVGGTVTTGTYRLLVGLEAPEVLRGKAVIGGGTILRQPTMVKVGVNLDQITHVDQKAKNFGVVANIMMEWQDPKLAFSPESCQCLYKTLSGNNFEEFADKNGIIWPQFVLFNQQGTRWSQNQAFVIEPDGRVTYFERFSATLQAPDFDFREFPFDTQQFFIRIHSLFPEEFYTYTDLEDFTGVGKQLGEEEWMITKFDTSVSSSPRGSRFSFQFEVERQITYYIFRVIVPILLIIAVAWVTFFLKDFVRRIEVTSANLLVFVAFNFTISDSLPRLAYLTLMDTLLISTFVISAFVVIYNVALRRLEVRGNITIAETIDKYTVWVYPFLYVLSIATLALFFM